MLWLSNLWITAYNSCQLSNYCYLIKEYQKCEVFPHFSANLTLALHCKNESFSIHHRFSKGLNLSITFYVLDICFSCYCRI